jgi:hypothetical protein
MNPLSGVLMIIDHEWWPVVGLIGGAIYFDTSGREAAKYISLRHEGVKMGTKNQQRIFFSTYMVMAAIAISLIAYSINALHSKS